MPTAAVRVKNRDRDLDKEEATVAGDARLRMCSIE